MKNRSLSSFSAYAEPLFLIVANVLSLALGNAISIVLARNLSPEQFGNYVGTLATVALLASLAEAGFGKYGLKVVPVFWLGKQMRLLRGYLRFSILGFIVISLTLGLGAAWVETAILGRTPERVMLYALIFLPGIAAFGVMIDLLLGFGKAIAATVISRIVVPLCTLVGVCVAMQYFVLTPYVALLVFGCGSLMGALLATIAVARIVRRPIQGIHPQMRIREWASNGVTFLAFGFLVSWVFKAPLFLAHHLPHDPGELALLAPALEIGCWVLLLSKSTDKYFQPTMAVLIESKDWAQGMVFRRNRLRVIGMAVIVFLAIVLLAGRRVLSLYGDGFSAAFDSLVVIAVGSSVWTLFSLAPSYLLFVGERSLVLKNMAAHAIVMVAATAFLFTEFGAIGAAIAYAVVVASMALVNLWLANMVLARRQSHGV
ncbi:MAG: hypothetical protein Aurels2KO_11160 [Aureliella sp.]